MGNHLSIKCEQIGDHLLSCIIYSHAPGNTVTQTVVLIPIIPHIAVVFTVTWRQRDWIELIPVEILHVVNGLYSYLYSPSQEQILLKSVTLPWGLLYQTWWSHHRSVSSSFQLIFTSLPCLHICNSNKSSRFIHHITLTSLTFCSTKPNLILALPIN